MSSARPAATAGRRNTKVQASISEPVFAALEERAIREQRSISAVIALAIAAYLREDQGQLPLPRNQS